MRLVVLALVCVLAEGCSRGTRVPGPPAHPQDVPTLPEPAPAAPPARTAPPAVRVPVPAPAPLPPCGEENEPDCPLQAWMNHTMNAALTTKSAAELETAFAQLAKLEPPGFPQWSTLAQTGKDAAARADFSAVKRVCSACHEQYRPLYRKEMRARPLTLASPP